MPYATLQDLLDRFGETEILQLTDRENAGTADPTVVDRALADAAHKIDGYLAGRYALPFASPPPVLVPIACDLIRYALSVAPDETVKDRHADAVRFLEAVARGSVSIGATADEPTGPEEPGGMLVNRGSRDRLFSETLLDRY